MRFFKKTVAALLAAVLMLGISGCGASSSSVSSGSDEPQSGDTQYYVYYLNSAGDKIVSVQYTFQQTDPGAQAMELVGLQSQDPLGEDMVHLLPDGVTIDQCNLEDGKLQLDLSAPIETDTPSKKILIIGGLVRTFIQIDGVDSINITEQGEPVTDSEGNELTNLTLDDFVENAGKSINNYLYTTMTLYFADETGTHLVPEKRKVYYSSNEPMEKAVIEALIQGPTTDGLYPVLPQNMNVLSTHTQSASNGSSGDDESDSSSDGSETICYVSLDKTVQTAVGNVTEEASLYAIVNSLVDTCHVDKVQFSINGETDTVFRKEIKLTQLFEKKEL